MTYLPENVLFDGSTNSMSRGADLTGMVDGKLGLVSFWLNTDVDTRQFILSNSNTRFEIEKAANGQIQILGFTSTPTGVLDIRSSVGAVLASRGWVHVVSSWNLGTDSKSVYINDAADLAEVTFTDGDIEYTRANWSIGATTIPNIFLAGALADLYFTNEYLDLSIEANRRKFLTASGSPVDLGSDGSLPTGTAPLIYMKQGGTTSLGVNAGTGGNFTAGGSYTATLGPPDKRVEANPWVFVHADHYEGQANAAETPAPNFNLPFYIKHFVVYGGASGGTVTIDNDGSATRSIVPATEVVANTVTVIPIEDYTDGVYITTLDAGITVHCFHGEDIDEEDF